MLRKLPREARKMDRLDNSEGGSSWEEESVGWGRGTLLPLVREGAEEVRPSVTSLLTPAHHRPHRASVSPSVEWEAGGITAWHTGSALQRLRARGAHTTATRRLTMGPVQVSLRGPQAGSLAGIGIILSPNLPRRRPPRQRSPAPKLCDEKDPHSFICIPVLPPIPAGGGGASRRHPHPFPRPQEGQLPLEGAQREARKASWRKKLLHWVLKDE